MTVDVAKLRELLDRYEHSKVAEPDEWYPNDALGRIRADDRSYHVGRLANALLNTAPELLAVFEAACKDVDESGIEAGYISRALIDAVDAARRST